MSRYTGSVCKICRREKEKLILKGEKCISKCTLDAKRGKNPPGAHGQSRMKKVSEYGKHLREKQKARQIYGLTEEQFSNYFKRANKMKGLTGENLFKLLETRLDNVVFRLGFVPSRRFARQIVNHGNILVNNKIINLPGYQLKPSDKISLKDKIKENAAIKRSLENIGKMPSWLNLDKQSLTGSVVNVPSPEEFSFPINSQLIVELYSK